MRDKIDLMVKAFVILLTVILLSITYGLFSKSTVSQPSPKVFESEKVELALRFASHLEANPSTLEQLKKEQAEEDSSLPDPKVLEHTLLSRGKNISSKPNPSAKESKTLYLKSRQDPLQFETQEEWVKWLHEGTQQQGARFIESIAWEPNASNFLDALEMMSQLERDPAQLRELTQIAIESASRILRLSESNEREKTLKILELFVHLSEENSTAHTQIEQLLNQATLQNKH